MYSPFHKSTESTTTSPDKTQMEEVSSSEQTMTTASKASFALPTELHLQIASYLTYPDALSLKHTDRHFYSFIYIGVNLKVEWLINRRTLHLDCPHNKKCELGSDMRFCRGSAVDEETEGAWRM
ncbi:hypothetical protein IFR04_007841 [Cadophora malorum]|uniref:F-box domain-containing protein n=1 Tax=Cadophora malorum TaxID=108018 RepID=A0A8H7TCB1_9HELO|nr:hypothetical protein IFR04_007841 [Cadophora malorum]